MSSWRGLTKPFTILCFILDNPFNHLTQQLDLGEEEDKYLAIGVAPEMYNEWKPSFLTSSLDLTTLKLIPSDWERVVTKISEEEFEELCRTYNLVTQ